MTANRLSRRQFLSTSAAILAGAALTEAADEPRIKLVGEVGITTSSVDAHLAPPSAEPKPGQFRLWELPAILRDELGMRVIDLNTRSLGSLEPAHLDRFRAAVEKAGCVLTNLKMNYADLDMGSPDADTRARAMKQYQLAIDAASRLKMRWARPLPTKARPHLPTYIASFRELADYANERGIQMLVENYGWMDSDADSVPQLIKEVGRKLAACPDTGNWSSDEVRYAGLAKVFPLAVTCDFKARELGPQGEHAAYDLKRCFQIGWDAGFRGPWCLEHAHRDRRQLFRELALLRDLLRQWTAAAKG
jgi:hypothetical protein